MKFKFTVLTLVYLVGLQILAAEEYTLNMLIDSLGSSVHFTKTETMSQIALHDFKTSKASLYPSINGGIPFTLSEIDEENYTIGLDNQKNQLLTAAPEISISQLLPTAGLLTAQISDSVSMTQITESSLLDPLPDPTWTNSAAVSVNLSQPVLFKGAFNATLEIINNT